jgi:hypothetical protein
VIVPSALALSGPIEKMTVSPPVKKNMEEGSKYYQYQYGPADRSSDEAWIFETFAQ